MRSRATRVALGWTALALTVGAMVMINHVTDFGGISSILAIGIDSDVYPAVRDDFVDLAPVGGIGHDGQYTYVVAVDPLGDRLAGVTDHPGYRYRRLLLSLIGGLGGLLRGESAALAIGVLNLVGFACAAGLLSLVAREFGAAQWVTLAVVANPGLWQGLRISTSDSPGLALALAAILMWRRRGVSAAVGLLLALSALTKDQYLLVAASIAGWEFFQHNLRQSVRLIASAVGPLALWSLFLELRLGDGAGPSNFTLPIAGIVEGSSYWASTPRWEQALVALVVVSGVVALIGALRTHDTQLRWLVIPWLVVALVSSHLIWAFGNNLARVFAPLAVLGSVAYASSRRQQHSPTDPVTPLP